MATRKKTTRDPGQRKALSSPTLIHMVYHPEEGVVSGGVQQDVQILGETQRHGRDIRVAVDDLSADIRKHLDAAFAGVAKHVGAKGA